MERERILNKKKKITRREFLKQSAGSATFLAWASTGLTAVQACSLQKGTGTDEFSDRVAELLNKMTPAEKISQLRYDAPAVPRLNIPQYNWWNECLHGVGRAGYATVFPQAIGMAASWNAPLLNKVADAIADEARAKHQAFMEIDRRDIYMGLTFWTPNINIVRDPRWGRGQETYGEDPYLTGSLGNAFIRGLQGDDPKYYKVIATAKHFAVYNGPEPLRHQIDVEINDRDLYETYLPAFETAVNDAKVASIMCAYNSFRGMPCCVSDPLLNAILRNDWNFDGYVVSDCRAIKDLYIEEGHNISENVTEAAVLALNTGTDLNCGNEYPHLKDALKKGMITEGDLDNALQRLFEARFRLGMFDDPEDVPYSNIPYSVVDSDKHRELALQMSRESIVLLKNESVSDKDQPLLPLSKELNSLAVIGPNADNYWTMLGNYHGMPAEAITPLQGIRDKMGDDTTIRYARGSHIAEGIPALKPIKNEYLKPAKGEGNGLYGEYFENTEFQGTPAITRVDEKIDFIWLDDTPVNGNIADTFSVRWQGTIEAPVTGTYRIGMNGMNSFSLSLEGGYEIDYESKHIPSHKYFEADLQAGETYKVKIEFYNYGPNPQAQLVWEIPQDDLLQEAQKAAQQSDAVILCLGLNAQLEGEEMDIEVEGFKGGDKTQLSLPAPQIKLMKEIYAIGKPVILVLMSGSAVSINWADQHIPSILQAWYGGQAGGCAVADVLFGDYNPAGRLPVTFYKSVDDLPPFTNYDMDSRTYKYFKAEPLYPFGYGLSYTSFDYTNLQIDSSEYHIQENSKLKLTVDIMNSGNYEGDEVVQLYVSYLDGGDERLQKVLKGYQRLSIISGETKTAEFVLDADDLATWDGQQGQMGVQSGKIEVQIGSSSSHIKLTEIVEITT